MSRLSNIFLFVPIHHQQKIKQMNCFFSLFNKYMERCDVHVCYMISIMQYLNFPLSDRCFLDSFSQQWNTKKSFRPEYQRHIRRACICVYARITICVCAYSYTRIRVYSCVYARILIRVCAYNQRRMCVYSYAYVRIMRVCAVNAYLNGTVLLRYFLKCKTSSKYRHSWKLIAIQW